MGRDGYPSYHRLSDGVVALCIAAILSLATSMSAQPITIDFENIPIGTPAEAIDIPGIRFVCGVTILPCTTSGFTVQDLATYAKDLPAGVTLTKASGRALVLRRHQGEKLAWDLSIVVDSPLVSISSAFGGYGCWGIDDRSAASYALGWSNQPCLASPYFLNTSGDIYGPYERDFTYRSVYRDGSPAPLGNYGWYNEGGRGFQLYTPGQPGPVGPDVATYFVDNIVITPYTGTDTCHFGAPLHLLPPYDYTHTTQNPPPPIKAGEVVRVAWDPVAFQPGSTARRISIYRALGGGYAFPVTCADPTHGYYCAFLDETATSTDWIPPRTQGGDRVDQYLLYPEQHCGSELNDPQTSLFVRVIDPPDPLRIDTISPSVGLPGSALTILGSGFVGTPSLADTTTTIAPGAKALDFVPPGNISVQVGGVAAKVTVVDNRTLTVIVPQLLNGPAGIVIHTVYGEVSRPASIFTVGAPPLRRRSASH
jgi:hypothetical protein